MKEYPISTSIHLTLDNTYTVPFDKQINRIIDGGFRWLDVNFTDHCNHPRAPLVGNEWEKWVDLLGDTAAKRGAGYNQVLSCGTDMNVLREYCRRSFIGCKTLGIPWMVFHQIDNPAAYGSDMSKFEYNKLYFSWMLEDAHKYGVGIAIENIMLGGVVRGETLNPVDFAIALCDEMNDPLVGICCDVGHCHIRKFNIIGTPTDTIDVGENLRRIGRRLRATHIHDNMSYDDDHIPPFMGNIDWKGVMRALDDIDYRHSFTFEAHRSVYGMMNAGVDDSVIDTVIHLLYQIGDALIHLER